MSSDLVKAEVHAVRSLRHAVMRYAEQIRDAANGARRAVAATESQAREAVERRRAQLQRAERDLAASQAALPRYKENCGQLRQEVAGAQQRVQRARQQLDRARRAAQIVSSAQSDLAKALQTLDASVGEHSSVAASALRTLDERLSELPHFDLGHVLQSAMIGGAVAIETAIAVPNLAKLAGNAAQAFGADPPVHTTSLVEAQQNNDDSAKENYASKELEDRKRQASGEGRETVA